MLYTDVLDKGGPGVRSHLGMVTSAEGHSR